MDDKVENGRFLLKILPCAILIALGPYSVRWPLVKFDIGDQTNSDNFCPQHLPQGEEEGW